MCVEQFQTQRYSRLDLSPRSCEEANEAAKECFEKSRFIEFLHELCSGIEEPIQTNGRPRLPLKDIIFAAVYKTYTAVSARRFASDLRDALAKGLYLKDALLQFPSLTTFKWNHSLRI